MPTDFLPRIPAGTDVFLDANIFVYAFTDTSPECTALLDRCIKLDVYGITSIQTINEVTHRLMMFEAAGKGFIPKPRANLLSKRPDAVRQLTDYWRKVSQVFAMNLSIVPITESILQLAYQVRNSVGLLTHDSVVVAAVQECGLTQLASHDGDFARVDTLTLYRPGDVQPVTN